MAKKKEKKSTKKNQSLFAVAVVVLAFIVILIIFLVNKDQIFSNYKETNFFDRVVGTTPEFIEKHEILPKKDSEEEKITLKITPEKKSQEKVTETKQPEVAKSETVKEKEPVVIPETTKSVEKVESKTESSKTVEEKKTAPAAVPTSELQVCFVYIDPDGSVLRKIVKKSVPKSDSPLTASINLLLKGPDISKAEEKNCMSLIPPKTRLLGARVQDGVAYLNFSDDIQSNEVGIDGFQGSLMQIVYTATAFSTVNSVQFLIEGEKIAYLSEGIWIGSPLSRGSF